MSIGRKSCGDSMLSEGLTRVGGGERESMILRDCGIVKDQINELHSVVSDIAERLAPVRVEIPVKGLDNSKGEAGPAGSPVAESMEQIMRMIEHLHQRLLNLREEIRA